MVSSRILMLVPVLLQVRDGSAKVADPVVVAAVQSSYMRLVDGYNLVASSTDFSLWSATDYRNQILSRSGSPPTSVTVNALTVLHIEGASALVRIDRTFHGCEQSGDSVLALLKEVHVDDWKIRWQVDMTPWPIAEQLAAGRQALETQLRSSLESLLGALAGTNVDPLENYLYPSSREVEAECRTWVGSTQARPGMTVHLDRFDLVAESDRLPIAIATVTTSVKLGDGVRGAEGRRRGSAVLVWRKELGGPLKVCLCRLFP